MTAGLTRGKSLSRAWWTRVRAIAHPTIAHAAEATGVDRSHLSRWESATADHPVPMAVLWSPALVADDELDGLVRQVRADRAADRERAPLATAEGALASMMGRAVEMLGAGVEALADGRVAAHERARLRPMLAALGAGIRRTLKAWDACDAAEATQTAVVPMKRRGAA